MQHLFQTTWPATITDHAQLTTSSSHMYLSCCSDRTQVYTTLGTSTPGRRTSPTGPPSKRPILSSASDWMCAAPPSSTSTILHPATRHGNIMYTYDKRKDECSAPFGARTKNSPEVRTTWVPIYLRLGYGEFCESIKKIPQNLAMLRNLSKALETDGPRIWREKSDSYHRGSYARVW